MKFYFCNSYQQSAVGFQYACLDTADMTLRPIDPAGIAPLQIQSAMANSGARCLIGYAEGNAYFLLRGIESTDESGRIWYINLAIVSDDETTFENVVQRILTNYKAFSDALMRTFRVSYAGSLSYCIVPAALREWLGYESAEFMKIPFYQKNHFATNMLRSILGTATARWKNPLFFLVPESTLGYFQKHNPVFSENTPEYQLQASVFQMLLEKDAQLFFQKNPQAPGETVQSQSPLSHDQMRLVLGIATIACLSLVATAYVYDRLKCQKNGRKRNG